MGFYIANKNPQDSVRNIILMLGGLLTLATLLASSFEKVMSASSGIRPEDCSRNGEILAKSRCHFVRVTKLGDVNSEGDMLRQDIELRSYFRSHTNFGGDLARVGANALLTFLAEFLYTLTRDTNNKNSAVEQSESSDANLTPEFIVIGLAILIPCVDMALHRAAMNSEQANRIQRLPEMRALPFF